MNGDLYESGPNPNPGDKIGRSRSMEVDDPQVWKRMVQNIKLDRPRVLKWTAYKYERGRFKTTVLVFQNRREMYGYKNCKSRIHLNSF